MDKLTETFAPLWRAAAGIELSDPEAACVELTSRFDPSGEEARSLEVGLEASILGIWKDLKKSQQQV